MALVLYSRKLLTLSVCNMLKPPTCHWFLQDTLEFVMSCDLTSFGIVATGPAPKTETLATTGPYLVSCLGSRYEG